MKITQPNLLTTVVVPEIQEMVNGRGSLRRTPRYLPAAMSWEAALAGSESSLQSRPPPQSRRPTEASQAADREEAAAEAAEGQRQPQRVAPSPEELVRED